MSKIIKIIASKINQSEEYTKNVIDNEFSTLSNKNWLQVIKECAIDFTEFYVKNEFDTEADLGYLDDYFVEWEEKE